MELEGLKKIYLKEPELLIKEKLENKLKNIKIQNI
jgi:hypothetical protein